MDRWQSMKRWCMHSPEGHPQKAHKRTSRRAARGESQPRPSRPHCAARAPHRPSFGDTANRNVVQIRCTCKGLAPPVTQGYCAAWSSLVASVAQLGFAQRNFVGRQTEHSARVALLPSTIRGTKGGSIRWRMTSLTLTHALCRAVAGAPAKPPLCCPGQMCLQAAAARTGPPWAPRLKLQGQDRAAATRFSKICSPSDNSRTQACIKH